MTSSLHCIALVTGQQLFTLCVVEDQCTIITLYLGSSYSLDKIYSEIIISRGRDKSHFMFNRLAQLSKHLTRPLSTLTNHVPQSSLVMFRRPDGKISTAGCLIIGDEVLGGKVGYMFP
jgi:hypothetical protein